MDQPGDKRYHPGVGIQQYDGEEWIIQTCRLCDDKAVALVAMDAGCVCFPDDRAQWLCAQHLVISEPLGSFETIYGWLGPGYSSEKSWIF